MNHFEAFSHFMQNYYDAAFPPGTRVSGKAGNAYRNVQTARKAMEEENAGKTPRRRLTPKWVRAILERHAPGLYEIEGIIVFRVK